MTGTTPHEQFKKFPLNPHHEVAETFADQFIFMTGGDGTVRLDLGVARMNEPKPPAHPTGERHVTCRLVLSMNCFIDLLNSVNQLAAGMAASGLIKMEGQKAKPGEKLN
jgi:hypothetical protein